ncbi:MAG: hypothetical protein V7678_03820 [Brevundimonas sp.]
MGQRYAPDRPCLSDEEFERVCHKFEALGDRLCDQQMLELADRYHEMLRQRRAIRARHPRLAHFQEERSWDARG